MRRVFSDPGRAPVWELRCDVTRHSSAAGYGQQCRIAAGTLPSPSKTVPGSRSVVTERGRVARQIRLHSRRVRSRNPEWVCPRVLVSECVRHSGRSGGPNHVSRETWVDDCHAGASRGGPRWGEGIPPTTCGGPGHEGVALAGLICATQPHFEALRTAAVRCDARRCAGERCCEPPFFLAPGLDPCFSTHVTSQQRTSPH